MKTINYELWIENYELKRGISSVGLEHLPCTQGVKGSSPLFSTEFRDEEWGSEERVKKKESRQGKQTQESKEQQARCFFNEKKELRRGLQAVKRYKSTHLMKV